jgi:hypothetical protein
LSYDTTVSEGHTPILQFLFDQSDDVAVCTLNCDKPASIQDETHRRFRSLDFSSLGIERTVTALARARRVAWRISS